MIANLSLLFNSIKQRIKLAVAMLVGAIFAIIKPKDIQRILDDHLEMAEKRNKEAKTRSESAICDNVKYRSYKKGSKKLKQNSRKSQNKNYEMNGLHKNNEISIRKTNKDK